MAQTVIGLFDSASDAQKAVEELVSKGFSRSSIDVSSSSSNSGLGSSSTGTSGMTGTSTDLSGTASNMLGTAGSTSSTYGSTSGEHEGVGSSIGRFFSNLFGSDDDDVNTYSGVASQSGSIVTVHAQSSTEAEQAADILDDNGAMDVKERASQYGYTSGSTSAKTASDMTTNDTSRSIPIIEEELQVGKRTVQTGGARLRSRIVERPVEESLRLREERVTVERRPVDRAATSADFSTFKEGTIEVTESAEVPVVSKEARVVEEVSLGKEVNERQETIRDTVRKTEVDIENIENTSQRSGTTSSGSFTDTDSSSRASNDTGSGSSTGTTGSGSGIL